MMITMAGSCRCTVVATQDRRSVTRAVIYLKTGDAIKLLFNFLLLVSSLSQPETVGASFADSKQEPSAIDRLSDWLLSERPSDSVDLLTNQPDFQSQPNSAAAASNLNINDYRLSPCQLVPVMHVLHQYGCHAKAIDSFACVGSCLSYVQVSSSKFWERERSCSCCQQTGLKEATFTLDCPSLDPPYRKVKTFAPVECLCRSCTDLGRENLQPQELVEAMMTNQ